MTSILVYGRDISDPDTPVTFADGVSVGNMALGAYSYKYTFRTRYGETLASPPSGPVTVTRGSVDLSDIPLYPNNEVTARRIYRTSVGDVGPFRFIAEITDNITTTYTDLAPDSALGAAEPIANFASTVGHFEGWHRFNRQLSRSQGSITAAGLVQSTATLIGDYEYVYVTVPVNNNGVRLPAINPNLVGLKVTINNTDMFNSLNVYPYELTTAINGGVPAAPYSILPSFSLELICNSSTGWVFASSLTAGVAGPPSGTAGGDLTGTYPAPALVPTGVTAGTYGSSTEIPVISFDSKGRATSAINVTASNVPGGAAGGDLAGTYPNPDLSTTGVIAGTYGNATNVPIIAVDSKGRVTSATSTLITAVATGPAGGDLAGTYPNPDLSTTGVTAGTYGSTSQVPVLNVDAKGRITSALNVLLTSVPGGAAGGDLAGTYPNPVLAPSGATPGTFGNATNVPILAVDAKGRITSIGTVPIGGGPPSGAAGGSLTGTYPNPAISSTGVLVGTYTKVGVNLEGRVTSGALLNQADIPSPIGDITGTYIATVVSSVQGVGVIGVSADKVLMISNNASNTALSVTAFGVNALFANTTGPRNTAFGADVLAANVNGADNTAVGALSLVLNFDGNRNVAFGKDALKANVSGNDSTGIGYLSLGLATGSNNTAVGASSGAAITTGSGNVIFGIAGSSLSTGDNNIIIGQASNAAATAASVVTIGHAAAAGTGIGQISIGKDAGNIASSGAANISIGTNAGAAITTGANNTIVGPNAGATLTTGSNNILIGNGATPSAITVSNEITLGDIAITRVRFAGPGAIPSYIDKADADSDVSLPSGSLYKFASTGQLMIKL